MKIRDKPVDKALGLLISESTNGKVKPNLCKIYSQPNNEGPVRLVGIGWAGWFDQPIPTSRTGWKWVTQWVVGSLF